LFSSSRCIAQNLPSACPKANPARKYHLYDGFSYQNIREQSYRSLEKLELNSPGTIRTVSSRQLRRSGYHSRDDMLFDKPIEEPEEDKVIIVWQVLLHVVNHGTDHRAQLLRLLNDLGVKTGPQDYIFYVYDHLQR
jgi:hypothetical protein